MKTFLLAALAVCLCFAPLAAAPRPEPVDAGPVSPTLVDLDANHLATPLMCRIDEWGGASGMCGPCWGEISVAEAHRAASKAGLGTPTPRRVGCGWPPLTSFLETRRRP